MGQNLTINGTFRFSCHEQLACFKQCCRDINIFLTPYDVLRMKNQLGLSSGEFLERHTHVLRVPGSGFPVVVLKMREDNLVCPFITDYGCQVYSVRPWSCRMAPVEVRGKGEYGIAFEPSRCHGLKEAREWTVKGWMDNQGLEIYNETEDLFGGIPLKIKALKDPFLEKVRMDMIFIACYDLDRFRKMLLTGPTVMGCKPEDLPGDLQHDDEALMKYAFTWLENHLNDEQVLAGIGKML
ncbi:YkgJ family cysteine cluster protein [Desulforamulus ruminis]|uniref:YkgJ family cysteine cluster protein n=1 Tax=Desulforamulus ruminis (strain ATCC 23193 / DSM 2154 / NCIMB 8452 / DL) TaxID=696281 RepID=F6DN57_DESRL|nr:YkgJ family cysteine cluster protein [Desulforamulus ruminis]AEG60646.1 protein of unknown function UPF0153 [Desulforamulus ruminis DSM 2154]